MKNDELKKRIYKHLSQFGTEKSGKFMYKGKVLPKNYILSLDGMNQLKSIEKNALLTEVNPDMLREIELHKYAHHLNSSQIMCYNFFRPFLEKKELLNNLFSFCDCKIIKNFDIKDAKFEFQDNLDDFGKRQTSFDFHYGKNEGGIYCEIKYTEPNFGNCKKDKEHRDKYNEYKKKLFNKCIVLENIDILFDDFCKNYQLFRNILRVVNDDCFTLFIIPKDAEYLKRKFYVFCAKYIKNEYIGKNVRLITWEEMVKKGKDVGKTKHMREFENRYLLY